MKFTAQIKTLGGTLQQARPRGLSAKLFRHEVKEETPVPRKPHVQFPGSCDLIHVHSVYSAEEYDREAVEDHTRDPQKDEIYDELIDYCENEMCVHRKSKDSVKHEYLYGKTVQATAHVRAKVLEANKKLGKKVDPTALLLANMQNKQKSYVLAHF
jgi:hypothetical protein